MASTEICYLSAVELAAAIRSKRLSPVEVAEATIERIKRIDPALNAFCTLTTDETRQTARESEAAVMRGAELGPLHGIPFSVKDNVHVKGVRMTSGSKLFEHNIAVEDSPVTARMRKAGAVLLGRTNTPEFGWKGVTDNLVFGITRNPWNLKLTPGGSSGGAAASVATGMGAIGLGTDGGGSLRIPSCYCGTVGFKATVGRIPNYPPGAGIALRHIGAITRTVGDTALALNVLAGPDDRDLTSLPADGVDYVKEMNRGIKGLKIAWSPDLGYAKVDPEVLALCRKAALRMTEAGATVDEVPITWGDPYECWSVFFFGASTATLGDKLAAQGHLLDPGLRKVVEQGVKMPAARIGQALLERTAFWQKVLAFFNQYDLLLTPTLPVKPFPVGLDDAPPITDKPMGPLQWTQFTYPFNLTGQPAVSVPCGWTTDNLPVGLQIVGGRFADATVLRAARAWEEIQPWHDRRPEVKG